MEKKEESEGEVNRSEGNGREERGKEGKNWIGWEIWKAR